MFPTTRSLVAVLVLSLGVSAWAENWPAWRGPSANGVTSETNLPLEWSEAKNVKWKVALPERGNSSPVVWGDRVFLTQAVGARRTLMCFDRHDGHLLWQEGPEWNGPEHTHPTNPFCSASPVTDGERVIAWFGSAGLFCWDLAGHEQWHIDLGKQDHDWGYGSSPVIDGDLCFLNFGPGPGSFLIAVDKHTGKEVWRFTIPPPVVAEGPGAGQGKDGSWVTPLVMNTGSRRELVVPLPGALFGLDPATGHELWHCNGLNPLIYASPVLIGDTIVTFGGYNGYAIGVKTGGTGDITATHRLWQQTHAPQRLGTGVAYEGHLYVGSDPGTIICLDPKTGQTIWDERPAVPGANSASWSSIVRSGDYLYLLTQSSATLIFRAREKFELVAVNPLHDGRTNSSLAVSNGDLFIRTHQHLWCIGTTPAAAK
jgi:outer membrane protein assembly factor BamB